MRYGRSKVCPGQEPGQWSVIGTIEVRACGENFSSLAFPKRTRDRERRWPDASKPLPMLRLAYGAAHMPVQKISRENGPLAASGVPFAAARSNFAIRLVIRIPYIFARRASWSQFFELRRALYMPYILMASEPRHLSRDQSYRLLFPVIICPCPGERNLGRFKRKFPAFCLELASRPIAASVVIFARGLREVWLALRSPFLLKIKFKITR